MLSRSKIANGIKPMTNRVDLSIFVAFSVPGLITQPWCLRDDQIFVHFLIKFGATKSYNNSFSKDLLMVFAGGSSGWLRGISVNRMLYQPNLVGGFKQ